jgi:hypothetical protein
LNDEEDWKPAITIKQILQGLWAIFAVVCSLYDLFETNPAFCRGARLAGFAESAESCSSRSLQIVQVGYLYVFKSKLARDSMFCPLIL